MEMSTGEIKRSYDEARNKKRQIGILADLNCCTREEIKEIIGMEDRGKPKLTGEEAAEQENEISLNDAKHKLFSRMEELNGQIEALEEEYKKIVIALEVIGNLS